MVRVKYNLSGMQLSDWSLVASVACWVSCLSVPDLVCVRYCRDILTVISMVEIHAGLLVPTVLNVDTVVYEK